MKKIILCILDGMGISREEKGNAFFHAKKPNYDKLIKNYPHTLLQASGKDVGLPDGQMGNSEVGHTNIGAGRIVYQSLEYLNKQIDNKSFYQNEELLKVINHTKKNNQALHIMGLLSDGGIHSHINHLLALIDLIKASNVKKVYYHLFSDGRDTACDSFSKYLKILEDKINETQCGKIASLSGRYYAMDRDNRYDRLMKVYETIILGKNYQDISAYDVWKKSQDNDVTDEFIEPVLLDREGIIKPNDGIICFNYRSDRLREIASIITNSDYNIENMPSIEGIKFVSFMPISHTVKGSYAFSLPHIKNTLGDYLASLNISQLRIAETEKYAHVTYFFDGLEEKDYPSCKKILIPSPKVSTYDLQPEMSAYEVTKQLLKEMSETKPDVIILNYANGDMVGHTGNYEAAVKAVETVDECLGKIMNNLSDYTLIITADHGNCEKMLNPDGSKNTNHTTNLVPFIITDSNVSITEGRLGDIAPSILSLMNLPIPKEMKGNNLITYAKKKI